MAGIGNSIDTDLVGEVIEVVRMWIDGRDPHGPIRTRPIARGLCRAVTERDGDLVLWLEIRTPADIAGTVGVADVAIGDVIRQTSDDGGDSIRIRLVKQP